MNGSAAAEILVVEDNATTARTLRLFLESAGYAVRWAAAGRDGLTAAKQCKPDLIVLDLMLPDLDGLDVCRQLRKGSTVPIVMLTARSTEDDIVDGLEAGADDYVGKPFSARELLARVARCLERQRLGTKQTTQLRIGALEMDCDRRTVTLDSEPLRLTRSEFAILETFMRQPGRVFTREQLIRSALGDDYQGFDRTIDTHIWSLRKKLGDQRGERRFIQSELGVGYRLSAGHET